MRVHSRRYANRMLRVGRLAVVFRGEEAEVPDWARGEYEWLIRRVPGVFPAASGRGEVAVPAREVTPVPIAPHVAEPAEPAAPPATADEADPDLARRTRGPRRPR